MQHRLGKVPPTKKNTTKPHFTSEHEYGVFTPRIGLTSLQLPLSFFYISHFPNNNNQTYLLTPLLNDTYFTSIHTFHNLIQPRPPFPSTPHHPLGNIKISNMTTPPALLWQNPSPETTYMWEFMQLINQKYKLDLKTYEALHAWSTRCVGEFWGEVWLFTGVRAAGGGEMKVSFCLVLFGLVCSLEGGRVELGGF